MTSNAQIKSELLSKKCTNLPKGSPAMSALEVAALLTAVPAWSNRSNSEISRTFEFADFHKTMDFVNAVAAIANQEDHHPDLNVSYDKCVVRFSTHSVGGLSENDFICAAKVDAITA